MITISFDFEIFSVYLSRMAVADVFISLIIYLPLLTFSESMPFSVHINLQPLKSK